MKEKENKNTLNIALTKPAVQQSIQMSTLVNADLSLIVYTPKLFC